MRIVLLLWVSTHLVRYLVRWLFRFNRNDIIAVHRGTRIGAADEQSEKGNWDRKSYDCNVAFFHLAILHNILYKAYKSEGGLIGRNIFSAGEKNFRPHTSAFQWKQNDFSGIITLKLFTPLLYKTLKRAKCYTFFIIFSIFVDCDKKRRWILCKITMCIITTAASDERYGCIYL